MTETKSTILIVEDDTDIADLLGAYFSVQGYQVLTAYNGEDALRACSRKPPDLVILDIRLPDIDGYQVARRLRASHRTGDTPIIFLTEKRARAERLQGLEIGAEDYITKPFDIQELRLRVRNALRRCTQGSLTNPITGLPEGRLVDECLLECLEEVDDGIEHRWAILLVSLKNLDNFREQYGFVASDDVLRAVSLMIHNALRDLGGPKDFLGQLGATDFVLFTRLNTLGALIERIQTRLEQALDYFYPLKDRQHGNLSNGRLRVDISSLTNQATFFQGLDDLKSRLLQ